MSRKTVLHWLTIPACGLLTALCGCATMGFDSDKGRTMTYHVKKAPGPMTIDANWDKPEWKNAPVAELTHTWETSPITLPERRPG